MGATIKDVARVAGVSTATVSRVVNQDPRITPATRARVLDAVDKLQYQVNSIARSLKSKRTLTIGLIAPEIANVFFMRVAEGVEDRLREEGYSMLVVNSRESIEREEAVVQLLIEKHVDGVIAIPAASEGAHFQRLRSAAIPVVLVDRLVDGFESDAILVDNEDAVYRTTSLLWQRGHRNFAFIGGQHRLTTAQERLTGFRRAVAECAIPVQEDFICFGDFHVASGYHLMRGLMERAQPPETVIIANYFMHIGAVRYLSTARERVTPNLFLASFDAGDYAAVSGVPGVSIVQPIDAIGRRAAEVLLERIGGRNDRAWITERLPTTLVENREEFEWTMQ